MEDLADAQVAPEQDVGVQPRPEDVINRLAFLEEKLVAQEHLASLGAIMAGIVHEIRNSLNFIINFGDLLGGLTLELDEVIESAHEELRTETAEDIVDLLGEMKPLAGKVAEHGRQANRIIETVLQQARGGATPFMRTDLNALTQEYVNLAYHGVRAKHRGFQVQLTTECDPALKPLVLNPQALGRVVLNVVSNALDALREAASSKPADYVPAVKVTTSDIGASVKIAVADNGVGIADVDLAQVLQPFFTTKRLGEGTGLGLSISRQIIEADHQGALTITSKPGEGTEVHIVVPKNLPERQ